MLARRGNETPSSNQLTRQIKWPLASNRASIKMQALCNGDIIIVLINDVISIKSGLNIVLSLSIANARVGGLRGDELASMTGFFVVKCVVAPNANSVR
jgi:hypothetical protein